MKKLERDFWGRFLSKDDTRPFDESSRGEETTFEVFYADNAEAPGQKIADSFPMYPVAPHQNLSHAQGQHPQDQDGQSGHVPHCQNTRDAGFL